MPAPSLTSQIHLNVTNSLNEDIYSGDLTAQLLPADKIVNAQVITREDAVLCGTQWFDGCFRPQDPNCEIRWLAKDGDWIRAGQLLCEIRGKARALLTVERSALNLLQTLSGTATRTREYVDAVAGASAMIMDTRKTLPGLRHAQKYAVRVGGGHNQRFGLYDGILIKENHIAAAGGIKAVLAQALRLAKPDISVQIEVENLAQLDEALNAGARLVLLDNFDLAGLRAAVKLNAGRAELEASGGITLDTLREVASTGISRISIGDITKNLHAIDFTMRILP